MFVKQINDMAILTEKTKKKKERNASIIKDYKDAMKKGSQRSAVYDDLSIKYKVSSTQVGRIVGNIKTKNVEKPYILLKFGSIKYADYTGSEEAAKISDTLNSIENDIDYQKTEISIIEAYNGDFIEWWGNKKLTKKQAKDYIINYKNQ